MSFVYANALLLLMVLLEIGVLHYHRKVKIPWKEIIFNLNSGHILMWVLRGVEIAAYHLVLTHLNLHLIDSWPYALLWVFGFIAWDFCFYWLHRFHHHFKLLWAVHVVHHEGEHFGLSLGIRNSWYSSLTSFPFFALLAVIGMPLEIFIVTSSIHYFVQFYNHNGIVNKSGILEKIMITPSHHRVHHGMNDIYVDKNFGGTLVIWDKLFGTFQEEMDQEPVEFGVKGYNPSFDIAKANNVHFASLLGFRMRKLKTQTSFNISDGFIAIAGTMLFIELLFFISKQEVWNSRLQILFFAIVFIGTVANGGISEGRKWGVVIWTVVQGILLPLFAIYHELMSQALMVISLSGMMLTIWLIAIVYGQSRVQHS